MSDKAKHIVNSEWLIRMLKKSSTIPQQRLLSVFPILSDWLDAPFMSELEVTFRPALVRSAFIKASGMTARLSCFEALDNSALTGTPQSMVSMCSV